jgi:hypothetical protein
VCNCRPAAGYSAFDQLVSAFGYQFHFKYFLFLYHPTFINLVLCNSDVGAMGCPVMLSDFPLFYFCFWKSCLRCVYLEDDWAGGWHTVNMLDCNGQYFVFGLS